MSSPQPVPSCTRLSQNDPSKWAPGDVAAYLNRMGANIGVGFFKNFYQWNELQLAAAMRCAQRELEKKGLQPRLNGFHLFLRQASWNRRREVELAMHDNNPEFFDPEWVTKCKKRQVWYQHGLSIRDRTGYEPFETVTQHFITYVWKRTEKALHEQNAAKKAGSGPIKSAWKSEKTKSASADPVKIARKVIAEVQVKKPGKLDAKVPVTKAREITNEVLIKRARSVTVGVPVKRVGEVTEEASVKRARGVTPDVPVKKTRDATTEGPTQRAKAVVSEASVRSARGVTPEVLIKKDREATPEVLIKKDREATPEVLIKKDREVTSEVKTAKLNSIDQDKTDDCMIIDAPLTMPTRASVPTFAPASAPAKPDALPDKLNLTLNVVYVSVVGTRMTLHVCPMGIDQLYCAERMIRWELFCKMFNVDLNKHIVAYFRASGPTAISNGLHMSGAISDLHTHMDVKVNRGGITIFLADSLDIVRQVPARYHVIRMEDAIAIQINLQQPSN